MIKDTTKMVNDYVDGMKQCIDVRDRVRKYVKQTYLPDSLVGVEMMKECEATFMETATSLKEAYLEGVQAQFEGLKDKIMSVVVTPVPDELMKMIPLLDRMSDVEKQMLVQKYGNNYMAQKLLNQGNVEFKTVEHLIDDIDSLQIRLSRVPDMKLNEYNMEMLKGGHYQNPVADAIEEFIDKYTVKGGDE